MLWNGVITSPRLSRYRRIASGSNGGKGKAGKGDDMKNKRAVYGYDISRKNLIETPVFLIDREREVRNVYSTSFLHPAIALNDLRTLVMEDRGRG